MSTAIAKSKKDIPSEFHDYDTRVYLDQMVSDYANRGLSRGIAIEEVAKICGWSTSRLRSVLFNGSCRITVRDFLDIRQQYLTHLAEEQSRALARVALLEAERIRILMGVCRCFIVSVSVSSASWHLFADWAGRFVILLCAAG